MLKTIKQLFPHDIRQRVKRQMFAVNDIEARLANLKRAGFSPRGIIDGGAYQGEWTQTAWRIWEAPTLMIEPQKKEAEHLYSLARQMQGSEVLGCALGSKDGQVRFCCEESNSRIIESGEGESVELCTLSGLLDSRSHFQPDLVKLDLQGHEINALMGAGKHLQRIEVLLLEVSVIRIGDVPVFAEVEDFMRAHGFSFYDVVPQYYRPRDGALWQMDVFYVRNDSQLRASNSWD